MTVQPQPALHTPLQARSSYAAAQPVCSSSPRYKSGQNKSASNSAKCAPLSFLNPIIPKAMSDFFLHTISRMRFHSTQPASQSAPKQPFSSLIRHIQQEFPMMKRFTFFLLLFVLAAPAFVFVAPAWAAKKITVGQLAARQEDRR
jgi:hypothetical protein